MPLPAEPVGVGSTWQAVRHINTGGFAVRYVIVYRLKGLEGAIRSPWPSPSGRAPIPRDMNLPNLPPGSTVRLNRFVNQGSGTMVIDLTQPVPVSAVSSSGETEMTISKGGQQQTMTLTMKLELVLHPSKVPAPKPVPVTVPSQPAPLNAGPR